MQKKNAQATLGGNQIDPSIYGSQLNVAQEPAPPTSQEKTSEEQCLPPSSEVVEAKRMGTRAAGQVPVEGVAGHWARDEENCQLLAF